MPQTFQVLKCYKCLVFQVQQTKKSNKFECKLCGEKQSIKRHYGLGNGKECRIHVQKLNGIRGEIDALKKNDTEDSDEVDENETAIHTQNIQSNTLKNQSKWFAYIDPIEEQKDLSTEESMYLGTEEVVKELPKKHRKVYMNKRFSHRGNTLGNDSTTEVRGYSVPCKKKPWAEGVTNDISPVLPKASTVESIDTINLAESLEPNRKTCEKGKPIINEKPLNKNSKWEQFVENKSDSENSQEYFTQPYVTSVKQDHKGLFTLCDDSEFDDILDI